MTFLRWQTKVNIDKTVSAIQAASVAAERMAGLRMESAVCALGGPHLASQNSRGVVAVSRDHAARVLRPQVRARQRDDDRLDALARHPLRGDGCALDGGDGLVEVDDHAFAQAVGRAFAHAEDAYRSPRLVRFRDDHRDPAGAKVETDGFLPPRQNCAETPPGTWGC